MANECGHTALWLACREGRVEVVEELLKAGADMRMGPPGGPTALGVAVSRGHNACAAVLLMVRRREEEKESLQGARGEAASIVESHIAWLTGWPVACLPTNYAWCCLFPPSSGLSGWLMGQRMKHPQHCFQPTTPLLLLPPSLITLMARELPST